MQLLLAPEQQFNTGRNVVSNSLNYGETRCVGQRQRT